MTDVIKVKVSDDVVFGEGRFVLVAGPCVLESLELAIEVASYLKECCKELGIPYIFKSSYDKANRTSIKSFRGPGIDVGLEWLKEVKERVGVLVLTDVHSPAEAKRAAEVVDVIQIPAFLCRQTDIVVAAAETGLPINVKKGQFISPWDVKYIADKIFSTGNKKVIFCERGTFFGYGQLVVDMRSLVIMRSMGYPVMFDATHSVQMPSMGEGKSGGDRRFVPALARAAVSVGVDAFFMEVHPNPDQAKSDGPNMVRLSDVKRLLEELVLLDDVVKNKIGYSTNWFV